MSEVVRGGSGILFQVANNRLDYLGRSTDHMPHYF